MTTRPLGRLVQVHKAIANPLRLRLLALLRTGPLCVCQMTAVVKVAASTVSEHLSELRQAGLVAERKDGRWVEYRLDDPSGLLDGVWADLTADPDVRADAMVVRELRRVAVDQLCAAGLDLSQIASPRLTSAVSRSEKLRSAVHR